MRIVIALGGNAIVNKGEKGTYEEQMNNIQNTMASILNAVENKNWELVITHGNGPQLGNILIQNAAAKALVPEMPMPVCNAMSQGQLGYLIQQSLKNLLSKRWQIQEVATVITQVVVDQNDPAFKNPSKPVGPFYSKTEANKIASSTKFIFQEDSGRGYRRIVPSPEPLDIVEIRVIKELIRPNIIVITAGGGGIPIICDNNTHSGVAAVIDKDKTSALLADKVEADLMIILTTIKKVSLNFETEKESKLDKISMNDAKKYLKEGHFAKGSMRPKIEAAIKFIEKNPKRRVLITHPSVLQEALEEKNGTWLRG